MTQHPSREHREIVRRLAEALEISDCRCPMRRLHTRECDVRHQIHTDCCNRLHAAECKRPVSAARGVCGCDRDCDCPCHPTDPNDRDCDCVLDPNDRCAHVAQADNPTAFETLEELYPPEDPDEGVLASWRRFLHEEVGGEYFQIEARDAGAICIDRAARVALLRQRFRRGVSFWNPEEDVLEDMALAQQCETVSGGTGRRTREVRHA